MLKKYNNIDIILASKSPRRHELLKGLDLDFSTINISIEENYPSNLKHKEITEFLCKSKATAIENIQENQLFITADTIVWQENTALEKPKDKENAIEILKKLSGKKHEVITSVGLFSTNNSLIISDITIVNFEELSIDEIEYYVEKYKPYDKAGAYGVQEWIGYIGVKSIQGSYYNVMGLPVNKLYKALKEFNF